MNRDELEREIEYADLLDALAKAKKGRDRDKLHAAKMAVYVHREKRRAAASPGLAEPGEARPAPIKVQAKVKGN